MVIMSIKMLIKRVSTIESSQPIDSNINVLDDTMSKTGTVVTAAYML